ncbi:glycerol-3-phosphate dehydrogenase/oxidase [Virgisporangium aurantiacum]|uniref:Glycerol-3-phosphate dehydrogenase n=1 Tax=Virgisporangium aurantiacum TaxID=175570 RepID=A0A8J3Z8H4_9ACTN|nr:glycerol-3-phosphate dehydrogenase/oxidase [Virgisporangium aurantiacum]GIJ59311.1 glycerol-3-phosphate dehydrogenase [Virgisporangium aurantiacum]
MSGSSLSAARRQRDLADLAAGSTVDLLVVGLGVTGAGVALDAAARGLTVAAVDAHDLAFGTSRWSSKLVHGGLRYLAAGHLGLAYRSAAERDVLLRRTAPHLVTALPFVLPLTPSVSRKRAAQTRAGFAAGDALRVAVGTPAAALPRSRTVGAAEVVRLVPAVRRAGLRGGIVQWDGQLVDDARLVVGLARTAAAHGARIVTRCRVEDLHSRGASVRDTLTGERHELRARAVVNATGVWAGGLDPAARLRPSRGTHLVLRAERLRHPGAALIVPVPGERNRFVFALPQADGLIYAGLTDEPVDGPVEDVPTPSPAEIGFLLDVLNTGLDPAITAADVVGAFAGLRPLLAGTARTTAELSRRHEVSTSPGGVTTVIGGKLTTYRSTARAAVDAAVATAGLTAGPCRTHRLPLVGAGSPAQLARVAAPARLVARYGVEAPAVVAGAAGDPALLTPIADGVPVTAAELLWAVRHEGALDESDLLDRRTRVGLVPTDRLLAVPAARAALSATTT